MVAGLCKKDFFNAPYKGKDYTDENSWIDVIQYIPEWLEEVQKELEPEDSKRSSDADFEKFALSIQRHNDNDQASQGLNLADIAIVGMKQVLAKTWQPIFRCRA